MKLALTLTAATLLALGTAACDRTDTRTSANGSTAVTTSDNASPNLPATDKMAPGPAGDASGAVSETMTTGKIKAAFAAESGLDGSDINVNTQNGVVTLSGSVKSQEQVSLAQGIAQRQDGVTRVESNLAVK